MRTPFTNQQYKQAISVTTLAEEYEALFSIYTNEYGMLQYNLLKRIHIPDNLPDTSYQLYHTSDNESWTQIAHKSYNSIKLWWVLYLVNSQVNPSPLDIKPGINLKIPTKETLQALLKVIRTARINEIR